MSESNLNLHSPRLVFSYPRVCISTWILFVGVSSSKTTCVLKKDILTFIKTLFLIKIALNIFLAEFSWCENRKAAQVSPILFFRKEKHLNRYSGYKQGKIPDIFLDLTRLLIFNVWCRIGWKDSVYSSAFLHC